MKKFTRWFAVIGISFLLLISLLFWAGLRVNGTPSYPIGLYWVVNKTPEKGDLVTFCPVDNEAFRVAKERFYITAGYCDGGYGGLMKRILAAKGDVISITEQGVYVNGELLPLSKPFLADADGREMPFIRLDNYQLQGDEILLMSDYSGVSFDARYYGVLTMQQVRHVVKPLLTQ